MQDAPLGSGLVVGVGPGLGWSVAKRLARGGRKVAAASRKKDAVAELTRSAPDLAVAPYACDATNEEAVRATFDAVEKDLGALDVVVFNAGGMVMGNILDMSAADVEQAWRVGCLAGFLVGREAARRMLPRGRGTILFTGATASLRGGARFGAFASSKFALRAIAQSMARELGPEGIHVAHVIIDGVIDAGRSAAWIAGKGPDAGLSPDAIAETYQHLVDQPRSAWTHEMDLRPFAEKF